MSPLQATSSHDDEERLRDERTAYPEITPDLAIALLQRLMGPTNLPPQSRPSSFASFDRSRPSSSSGSQNQLHQPLSYGPPLDPDSEPKSAANRPFATGSAYPFPSPSPSTSLDPYPPSSSQSYLFNSPTTILSNPLPYSTLASPFPSSLAAFAGPREPTGRNEFKRGAARELLHGEWGEGERWGAGM